MAVSENSTVPAVATILKREDYKHTEHDTHFSKWQVLIGPCDWEDYFQGKEGAARYRVHNLPTRSSPGLYELGIAVFPSGLVREVGKIDPDDIVVVYLGQADNVRSRLQHYGRSGSHLGNSYATSHWTDSKIESPLNGRGLFEEIFLRGYSIVFRCAPMKDKAIAEKTEAQLLDTFDYAWNKGSNGTRRPNDILQKLSKIASSTSRFSSDIPAEPDEKSKSFLHGIFKFSRSQPRLVSGKSSIDEDLIQICGFIMGDAIPCRRPPVPGRKRCEEHKGMRIDVSKSKSIHVDLNEQDKNDATSCGVNLGNGNFCSRQVVPGRKRCEEHKGMRINNCVSKPISEEKCYIPTITTASTNNNASTSNENSVCGAALRNGSVCSRQPVGGNKRCWQHKGKRVDGIISNNSISFSGVHTLVACGVAIQNGRVCMRAPVQGRKRCEQHKGMRVSSPSFW